MVDNRFDVTKKVYCSEWRLDHALRDTLGPGLYDQTIRLKKPKEFIIPKLDRGLLT